MTALDPSNPSHPGETGEPDDPVAAVRRWEDSGGAWRVLGDDGTLVTVALLRCDAGEEMARVTADLARMRPFLDGRTSSEDG